MIRMKKSFIQSLIFLIGLKNYFLFLLNSIYLTFLNLWKIDNNYIFEMKKNELHKYKES
jgi:hypothetical protein